MDDFYHILETETEDARFSAVIRFNEDHAIFKGHFPGSPVVPGACMIRLVHELMEAEKSVKLKLSSAENIKFLAVIDPRENAVVSVNIDYELTENQYLVRASIFSRQVIYFKLKGVFAIM